MEPPSERPRPDNPLEVYDRLLAALDQLLALAQRAEGDDQVREWAGLAALDTVGLGEQFGMLHDDDAEHRREAIRSAIEDLDRPGR